MHCRLVYVLTTVLMLALCLQGCSPAKLPTAAAEDLNWPIADFSLTERSGRTIQRADLEGKVWVAAFIFTRCKGPCGQVTGTLARLQHELAGRKDVVLVSFTVDPKYDTPKVLSDYAQRYGADSEQWLFLTGTQPEIYPLIQNSFRLGVVENEGSDRTAGDEVTHSTRLAVVDRRATIRTYVDGAPEGGQPDPVPRLLEKIVALTQEKP